MLVLMFGFPVFAEDSESGVISPTVQSVLTLLGPEQCGQGPLDPAEEVTIFVRCAGNDIFGVQTKLQFVDPKGNTRDDFRISLKNGNPDFGG